MNFIPIPADIILVVSRTTESFVMPIL